MNSLLDIQHILYINLDSRTDRREQIESELVKMNWTEKAERFSAISMPNLGAIGCSMSHLNCLKLAKKNDWTHVLILEDDVVFTDPEVLNAQTTLFFKTINEWDVLLFSGNCHKPYQEINASCVKVSRCLTTAAYLVKRDYYDTLIRNITQGIQRLIETKMKYMFAIDVYWMKLQERDRWYLIVPITATQRSNYSDIENAYTDFSQHLMELH